MKIIFWGTPNFAIPSLEKIVNSSHKVIAIVTAPDKERGRGQKVTFTPVKEFALAHNITVLQPQSLNDESFLAQLRNLDADLFVVVAFRILPEIVFNMPRHGSFNLHASVLPKYRGAAPIQWALINGEKETGVTTFKLAQKVDTGNLYLQEKIQIDEADNFQSLHDMLSILGGEVVLKTISMIESDSYKLLPQDDSLACSAPKITKETCRIDWNLSAREIHNLVRGLSPYPRAFFTYAKKVYKLYKTKVIEKEEWRNANYINLDSRCSTKLFHTKKEIFIRTGNGFLQILELQTEGRKRMSAEEFLRGHSFN